MAAWARARLPPPASPLPLTPDAQRPGRTFGPQSREEQEHDTHGYGGVGGVEDVPEGEVDVIGDLSGAQAVEEVAGGPAEDQTATDRGRGGGSSREQHPQHDPDRDRASGEQHRLAPAEDAEGAAVVLYVGEAGEARGQLHALPDPNRTLDDGL